MHFREARDGGVVKVLASHLCGLGSNLGADAKCGLSLLLVLSFALRGFSPGTPVFPSPQKLTFANSNSIMNRVDEEPLCGCATSKSLLLIIIIIIILLLLLLLSLLDVLLLLFYDCEKVEKMFWFCDLFMIKVHL